MHNLSRIVQRVSLVSAPDSRFGLDDRKRRAATHACCGMTLLFSKHFCEMKHWSDSSLFAISLLEEMLYSDNREDYFP
jgi:hypothetical protein